MAPSREFQLPEVLEFRPDEGVIRLHEQRVVILSAAAMGLLRKELITTLGEDSARRLLLRFGYADGYHDAISLRDSLGWRDPLEGFRAGAALHTLEGIVHAKVREVTHDAARRRFRAELAWTHSYEAEQHLHHYGPSASPVCWSLVGYVSGYASACVGHEVYFKELRCHGAGAARCAITGRDAASWDEAEIASLRLDFQGADLGAEVERVRAAVHRRHVALARREGDLTDHARELEVLRERVRHHARVNRFVLASPAMQNVLELAARVAPLDTSVLVSGESGTGKEFVVKMIHEQSARARHPLVSVNCAALTEPLLESELFGHVRGAFTGAVRDKPGLFEVASAGTLFLDEVGELAPALQAKLLRALQEGEIRRVGSERSVRVNPRVIAATNRDLRADVSAGRFREDLYFRLGAFIITVPPLRERPEAIAMLAQEFVRRAALRFKRDVRAIAPEAMTRILNYDWPGNVRELEHAMERAVILARGSRIMPHDLPEEARAPVKSARAHVRPAASAAYSAGARADVGVAASRRAAAEAPTGEPTFDLARQERELIQQALERFDGNRRKTAEALRISPVTLWRKIKRYGLAT
jgi:transcriptional regulator with GAF, ATPase, and Fis domain